MLFVDNQNRLWQEIAGIAADEGLELYDIELGVPSQIRVFIERSGDRDPEAEESTETQEGIRQAGGRVTSDDCSRLVRRLMAFFLAEGREFGMNGEPRIEVSSPGVNRHLRTRDHFRGAIGERVRVVADELQGGAVTGSITRFEDDTLEIVDETNQASIALPFHVIRKARVEFVFGRPGETGSRTR